MSSAVVSLLYSSTKAARFFLLACESVILSEVSRHYSALSGYVQVNVVIGSFSEHQPVTAPKYDERVLNKAVFLN